MKLTILKAPTAEDWILVKQAAFVTIGKETETEPSLEWKRRILQAVHSPIRELRYVVLMEDLPSWVSVHLVRHIHAQPYVSTGTDDHLSQETLLPCFERNSAGDSGYLQGDSEALP